MDGAAGLKLNCHSTGRDWNQCYSQVRAACPSGIVVDHRDGAVTAVSGAGKALGGWWVYERSG